MRLTHLHKRLPGISTGVLERGLQQMVALGLVTRTRFKEMPPRVELELTDAGRELLPIAGALARWGMRHMWSPPREHEQVDLDVLLRLLPVLVTAEAGLPEGSLEAVVTDADPPVRYRYLVESRYLRIDDRPNGTSRAASGPPGASAQDTAPATTATARPVSAEIQGNAEAWVAAFSPSGDHSRLRLVGDEHLAKGVLATLPGPADWGLSQCG
jgi:hypothetical protein